MNKFFCLIVILLFPLTALANVLTLYALPSAEGLDYSTPRSLFFSTLKNSFERRDFPLGHMFVEIKCQNRPAEMVTMTGEYRYLRQLFFEGRGLGILFQSVDGKLLEGRDVSDKVSQFLKEGKLSFINYQLNEGQCLRVTKY